MTNVDLERLHGAAHEHYAAGRLAKARQLYEEALTTAADARCLSMLGVIAAHTGDPDRAERLFQAAIALEPASGDQHMNLGLCRQHDSRPGAAVALRRAAQVTAGDARALVILAAAGASPGVAASAVKAVKHALCLAPESGESWTSLGQVRFAVGDAGAAATAFARAAASKPLMIELQISLAAARLRAGEIAAAWQAYEQVLMLRRASRWFHEELAEIAGPACGHISFRETSRTKLGHDLQQLRYLLALGLLPRDFESTVAAYESVLAVIGNRPLVALTAAQASLLAPTYNRVIYRRPPKPRSGPAVNPKLDDAEITARFRSQSPGIVWVDEVLTKEALDELHRYCLESTVWFDYRHPTGYVGSMLGDGFNSPLLRQIAEELPERLPRLFGDQRLTQLWAFKYESGHAGTDLHADAARLNVNFWITPDEANLTPGRAGLEVWNRAAPVEWDFAKFNNDQSAIRRFLRETNAERLLIPYRCNRAAIFDSDLFHRTDDFRFRPGYANRRINVTMLYGDRNVAGPAAR